MTSATRQRTARTDRSDAAPGPEDWPASNQGALAAALTRLRATLERYAARGAGADADGAQGAEGPEAPPPAARGAHGGRAPALEQLRDAFRLTDFECDLLLLCAAVELDARFPALCATAQGDLQRPYVTYSLALAALPGAHWSALSPLRPLRRWHLVEAGPGPSLTLNPLRIDERVLHYLTGVPGADPRLASLLQPPRPAAEMVPSQQALAAQIGVAWARAEHAERAGDLPLVHLCGEQSATAAVAFAVCATLGLTLSVLPATVVPTAPGEIETLARLWEREAVLTTGALLLDCHALEEADSARTGAVAHLLERTAGRLLLSSPERLLAGGRGPAGQRPRLTFEVHTPGPGEQRDTWQSALAGRAAALNGHIDLLVSQFDLSPDEIRAATGVALGQVEAPPQDVRPGGAPEGGLGPALWDACRAQARPRLDDLAQRLEPRATWEDLVLPEPQRRVLRDVAVQVRHRATVYERWGFAGVSSRGLGIAALFAGPSGTGKTLAAEVLAGALRLDLYRIDLSAVVSKYVGETEKNLRKVFGAAEAGGAVLLFDEADALFGKRAEVKDAHDRYANIETGYLLQRMEAYRGLAVLTTNMKQALDPAFLRRLRFVVQFPFPDAPQREQIWRRAFPAATPLQGVDPAALARLSVAGGTIRNIALGAAFAAADAGEPVQMRHLLRAAQAEYAKLERTLTEAELEGWEGVGVDVGEGVGPG